MATTYKKRRRAFGGEDAREKAVKRLQDEHRVSQGMQDARGREKALQNNDPKPVWENRPEQQRQAAFKLRDRANSQRRVTSHGGAPKGLMPGANGLKGIRMKGRGGLPRLHATGGIQAPTGGSLRLKPVKGSGQSWSGNGGTQGAALNNIAKQRAKAQQKRKMVTLPQRRKRRVA